MVEMGYRKEYFEMFPMDGTIWTMFTGVSRLGIEKKRRTRE